MWEGKYDDAMDKLFRAYNDRFNCEPDEYAEIAYELMTYEEFSGYIQECLEKDISLPRLILTKEGIIEYY